MTARMRKHFQRCAEVYMAVFIIGALVSCMVP